MTSTTVGTPAGIVLLGPTASGKSDAAMAWAAAHPATEIVAVDSMQVYRRMDIGTAKPTAADRAAIRHHGIDLVEPGDEFTVAQFQRVAADALASIAERRGAALVVAGTGLYLRAITDPMSIPGQWPQLRGELEAEVRTCGASAMHARLAALDAAAAARIEPDNARRVVRALEVTIGSGRPFSSYGPGLGHYPPTGWLQVGLRWERDTLRRRIDARVQAMMAAGLLDEVAALRSGELSRTARQALGYKELLEHLDGHATLDDAVARIVLRTQQFAVRQERWFRRDPRVHWIVVAADPVAEVACALERLTNAR